MDHQVITKLQKKSISTDTGTDVKEAAAFPSAVSYGMNENNVHRMILLTDISTGHPPCTILHQSSWFTHVGSPGK